MEINKTLLLPIVLWAVLTGALAQASELITVTGSTSALPMIQRAAEAFMKTGAELRVSVAARGSGDGIRSIIDGQADLAATSRPLREREKNLFAKKGDAAVLHRIAMGGVAPVVDLKNPITNLSRKSLRAVYMGEINNWKKLGGPDHFISVLSRDSNSGTYEIFRRIVMGKHRVIPSALMLASNGAMVQAVSGNRYALGYVGIGYLTDKIRPLAVEGVEASVENIASGRYPLTRPLFIVFRKDAPKVVMDFVRFLKGPAGKRIARQEGFVPLD